MDLVLAPGQGEPAEQGLRELREQLLGQLHQVLIVRVRLIELERRELGIVLRGDPLVPEVPVDLVHALEAAHDQPLEIELRRDPEIEVHVERVVVRLERPGDGAAGDRLHHRCLDLEEAARVEERADPLDEPRAQQEDLADLGVDDQVDVALAIARLDVLEPVPLLGQRAQRLGQERERLHAHRQLAGARAEHSSGDADEIADVELAEAREVVTELVGARVELDAAGAVHEVREGRLAVVAHGHHSAGEADGAQRGQLGLGRLLQPRGELARPVRDRVAAAERIDATAAKRLQLLLALADQVIRVALAFLLAHALPRAHSRYALMNSSRSPSITASTLPISTPVRWSLMRCSGWNV